MSITGDSLRILDKLSGEKNLLVLHNAIDFGFLEIMFIIFIII